MLGGRANYFINSFFGRNALSLEFSLYAISLNNDLGIFLCGIPVLYVCFKKKNGLNIAREN